MGKLSYGQRITRLAEADPDRIAVVCDDEQLMRGELERRANRMARAFVARGVSPGRRVTIGLPNGLEFVIANLAAWKCGAVPNPISPRLPAAERDGILALADPALVVGIDDLEHRTPTLPTGFVPPLELDDRPLPDVVSPQERAIASGGSTGRPKLILLRATMRGSCAVSNCAPRGSPRRSRNK